MHFPSVEESNSFAKSADNFEPHHSIFLKSIVFPLKKYFLDLAVLTVNHLVSTYQHVCVSALDHQGAPQPHLELPNDTQPSSI